MSRPPEARGGRAPKAGRWYGRSPWNRREPLTLKVTYRGGNECWVELHARGAIGRYPGHTAIIDILEDVWNDR